MISSPSECSNTLVYGNIWLITKFERGHPERGRFLRLGWVKTGDFWDFYQRVSIASCANRWYSQKRNVRPSVRLSVCLSTPRYCIKTKKASVMISSPSESLNILVSRNIWFVTKFERGHPEQGRFMRLGCVKIGNFGDFSTNPYLRNGAR